jgi:beta-lactam-binding protein with PASTA domain
MEDMTFDKKTPAGKIISQSVESNQDIPQGTTVNFVVSLGAEKTSVPDVTAMTIEEARETLENANLRCVLCYVSGDAESVDKILSQNYPPESVLPINTEVWLNVSVGSESRVESLGGWSGNPLPTPDGQTPIEITPPEIENPDLEIPPEENSEITNPPSPDE